MPGVLSRLLGGAGAVDPQADPSALARQGDAGRARLEGEFGARNRGGRKASLYVVREFLTAQECSRLIRAIDADATPSTLFNDGDGPGIRTSSTHYFADDQRDASAVARRIDDLLGLDRKQAETLQGQRYCMGEQYRHHSDFFHTTRKHWQRERLRGGQRTWTAMIYLNAVEAGGETDFPKLDLSLKPEPGMLVAWDNMTRRGLPNRATLHAGMPVERGRKYVITQWYRLGAWVRRLG